MADEIQLKEEQAYFDTAVEVHSVTIRGRLISAVLHLQVTQDTTSTQGKWRSSSDAADVLLDGWPFGQGPMTRHLSYPIHHCAAHLALSDG